jgi:hypothetical protein
LSGNSIRPSPLAPMHDADEFARPAHPDLPRGRRLTVLGSGCFLWAGFVAGTLFALLFKVTWDSAAWPFLVGLVAIGLVVAYGRRVTLVVGGLSGLVLGGEGVGFWAATGPASMTDGAITAASVGIPLVAIGLLLSGTWVAMFRRRRRADRDVRPLDLLFRA